MEPTNDWVRNRPTYSADVGNDRVFWGSVLALNRWVDVYEDVVVRAATHAYAARAGVRYWDYIQRVWHLERGALNQGLATLGKPLLEV